ncbi:VOC family protein [Pseudaestuariivita sp.]|uniref:VOC family protein n=1 Tax=Pseudaestuariivita sp. TaxID=2211669 RepID=UPI0040587DCD
MPQITSLDHLVLTVRDQDATLAFYGKVLGCEVIWFTPADGSKRCALAFGTQKINLHVAGAEFEPKARLATPGSADLCFLSDVAPDAWCAHFERHGIEVIDGPVTRSGATGPIMSVYVRDPDGNLIEVSQPAA